MDSDWCHFCPPMILDNMEKLVATNRKQLVEFRHSKFC